MSSGEIVTIIAAVGVALVQVIAAIKSTAQVQILQHKTEQIAVTANEKLAEIHTVVNGNLADVKTELKTAQSKIAELEAVVIELKQKVILKNEL